MSEIVILAASNNKNLELAKQFEQEITKSNVSAKVIDIAALELPLYSPLAEEKGMPENINQQVETLSNAKGFVFVAPEYNGGLPPVLTNLIAWISRAGGKDWRAAFNAKPAAIASFSGSGGIQALVSLRTQLSYIGINVLGRQVRGTFKEAVKEDDLKGVSELLVNSIK